MIQFVLGSWISLRYIIWIFKVCHELVKSDIEHRQMMNACQELYKNERGRYFTRIHTLLTFIIFFKRIWTVVSLNSLIDLLNLTRWSMTRSAVRLRLRFHGTQFFYFCNIWSFDWLLFVTLSDMLNNLQKCKK